MPRHNSYEGLERFHVVLSVDNIAWLDQLGAEIVGTGVKVSRSEIIRAALATLRELHQAARGSDHAMMGVIAEELERNFIRERVIAGLDQAQHDGTRSGRPVGRPRVVIDAEHVVDLRDSGLSWQQTARRLRAKVGTVRRAYKDAMERRQACKKPQAEAVSDRTPGTAPRHPLGGRRFSETRIWNERCQCSD